MFKRVATLFSGGLIAQLVTLLALPFLARANGPDGFGILASVMAPSSLLLPLVHGRYHLALPIARRGERRHILILALGISTILSFGMAIPAAHFMANDALSLPLLVLLIGAATLVAAWADILNYWRTAAGRWRQASAMLGLRAIVTAASQVLLASATKLGLVAGAIAGPLVVVATALCDCDIRRTFRPWRTSWAKVIVVARRHRGLPTHSSLQGFIASCSWNALPMVIAKVAGLGLAGQYWGAYRLLMAPLALFNNAYRQTALSVFGSASPKEQQRILRDHSLFLLACSFASIPIVFIASPLLLPLFFGEGWGVAIALFPWLWVGVVGEVGKLPLFCLAQARRQNDRPLRWDIWVTILKASAAGIAWVAGGVTAGIITFFVTAASVWTIIILYNLTVDLRAHATR